MKNVSICIPYIRPENMPGLIDLTYSRAGIDKDRIELLAEEDVDRIGCPRMLNRLVQKARHDLVCFIGDDTEPGVDFLVRAIWHMNKSLPGGRGLVGFNDGTGRGTPTHWMADRLLLHHLDGEFFHTGYTHCFCDNELMDRCNDLGRYHFAEEARVLHKGNQRLDGVPLTGDYARVYAHEVFFNDKLLYWRRKTNGWKTPDPAEVRLGIGLPLVSENVPVQFFTSFTAMDKGSYTLLLPKFPPGEFARDIGIVRNNLVEQAIMDGCTHLVMMDTDQIYSPDVVARLMSHGKPVVGGYVHRRWPPFDAILYRGELSKYLHVSDEECFSGRLVEVDATGCGCVLFDMAVFGKIEPPWFELSVGPEGNPVGEDIGFCAKLRAKGVPIFVDTAAKIGHLTTMIITKEFYQLFKKLKNLEWREEEAA